MAYIFRTLIVTAASEPLARTIAAAFGGGPDMWITPLSASGSDPASHYISTGYIPPEFAYMVPLQVWEQDVAGVWTLIATEPGDPVAVYNACVEAEIPCTQADIDAIYAAADVTEQEPFVALGRLGLAIVQPPIDF